MLLDHHLFDPYVFVDGNRIDDAAQKFALARRPAVLLPILATQDDFRQAGCLQVRVVERVGRVAVQYHGVHCHVNFEL